MKKGISVLIAFCVSFVIIIVFGVFFMLKNRQDNNTEANLNGTVNLVSPDYNTENDNIERSIDKVSMRIKEGTLTNTSVVVIIIDSNNNPYAYGYDFKIEKNEEEVWKELEVDNENYSIFSVAYVPQPNKEVELKIDFAELYGKLEKGEYRLGKYIGDQYVWVEFLID